jgi:nucleotide-binding universal stress UspA family protein
MLQISSIVHPTDFSEASAAAFIHALKIALTAKATLTVLHVAGARHADAWDQFPHVRRTLADWGLMNEHDTTAAIAERLGMNVCKVEMEPQSPAEGVAHYLRTHAADLIVLATEGREGLARLARGSVAERLARHSRAPALFVPAKARGFVDPRRGELTLKRVLIPVDHDPPPAHATGRIIGFARLLLDMAAEERLLHVGKDAPAVASAGARRRSPVALRTGDPVEAIVAAANEWPADLIGMPTAGHGGFLDALRGSTTERVLRRSPCPLLAVPAAR